MRIGTCKLVNRGRSKLCRGKNGKVKFVKMSSRRGMSGGSSGLGMVCARYKKRSDGSKYCARYRAGQSKRPRVDVGPGWRYSEARAKKARDAKRRRAARRRTR